jgi:hypothetical protein
MRMSMIVIVINLTIPESELATEDRSIRDPITIVVGKQVVRHDASP